MLKECDKIEEEELEDELEEFEKEEQFLNIK